MTKKASGGKSLRAPKAAKPANTQKKHALTPAMEARKWKPGQSGNPNGRPKRDAASEIAQAIFENNRELIYKVMLKSLRKGSAGAFAVLAERGYGKTPQPIRGEGEDGAILHKVEVEFVNVAALEQP